MNELNPDQKRAAEFKDGVCAVIAVPGSGKTRTMMERIGILVNDHGISPENILGLTFTKNASAEMKNRLIPVLGDLASRVFLATIHSFCHTVLRSEGRKFDILYGKEQIIFIKGIMKKLKIKDISIGVVLREISLAKNNLITVDEFRDLYVGDKTMIKIGNIYKAYDEDKSKRMLYDFDDLLFETYLLLKEDPGVREKYREIFSHLLAAENEIVNGYSDGNFRPANTVNTAEFLKILSKTFDLPSNLKYSFADVATDDWFAQFAGTVQKYDLFPDRGNRFLEPARELTRNEVVVAIYQFLKNR